MNAQDLVELIAAELGDGPGARADAVRVLAALHRAGCLAPRGSPGPLPANVTAVTTS